MSERATTRWWRPAAWLYVYGASPVPGAPACGTVACTEVFKLNARQQQQGFIKLRSGSYVQVDPVLAAWLRCAESSGWWAATHKALLGPFGTPAEAQRAVEEAIANGGLPPQREGSHA